MKRRASFVLCLALAALALPRPSGGQPAPCEAPPVIFLVEGVGGVNLIDDAARAGFRKRAGLPHELRQFYWNHGFGRPVQDLQDTPHLMAKAAELAAEVLAVREQCPGRRVFIVAHSAGTGLAAHAAEQLPPDTLDRIVFLSSALSPCYDLSRALAASKGGIVSFYSHRDWLMLRLGTGVFGTIDRRYGPSAGLKGFLTPPCLPAEDPCQYRKLVQIPWQCRMILDGNCGKHRGSVMPAFLADEVAPWLR